MLDPELWKIILNNFNVLEQQKYRGVCTTLNNIIPKYPSTKLFNNYQQELNEFLKTKIPDYQCLLAIELVKNGDLHLIKQLIKKSKYDNMCLYEYGPEFLRQTIIHNQLKIAKYVMKKIIRYYNKRTNFDTYYMEQLVKFAEENNNNSEIALYLRHIYDNKCFEDFYCDECESSIEDTCKCY